MQYRKKNKEKLYFSNHIMILYKKEFQIKNLKPKVKHSDKNLMI